MSIPNSMLNIMPYNCRYCIQGFKGMEHISQAARDNNINLTELQKTDAEKQPVWDTLASIDPLFVNGFGHGSTTGFTGDSEKYIFTTHECSILAERVVYFLSCYTAVALGPKVIEIGGIAYGGYNIAWTWMTSDILADPYDNLFAEAFYRSSNEFPIALIEGASVALAEQRCIAKYSHWIEIWETERSGRGEAAEVIKWLLHDRDGLTILGDLSATITGIGTLTAMIVDTEPPFSIHTNEPFTFDGRLIDKEMGSPLSKLVKLHQVGVKEPIATIITDDTGYWSFDLSLDKGVSLIYVVFAGDVEYRACYSPIFSVEVGLTTMMVTEAPSSSVEKGEAVIFAGILIDKVTGEGMPDRTVNLTGATTDFTITDADGKWSFETAFHIEGRYKLVVEFPGNTEFVKSSTEEYRISIGLLPIFGCDTKGNVLRSPIRMIIGTTFRAPEDGEAVSIVPYLQYTGMVPARMRCALYKQEDLSLLGITEEREFIPPPDKRNIFDWFPFILATPISIIKGEEYVLVGWADTALTMYYDSTGDYEQGVEQLNMEYDSFPDPLAPSRIRDTRFSMYIEYRKEVRKMTVTFAGSVSAQAAAGEEVTITVTLPGGGTEQVVALTREDKTFSTEYSNVPGNYKAKARVEADALYQAAESDEVPFVIGKGPRTIILTVT